MGITSADASQFISPALSITLTLKAGMNVDAKLQDNLNKTQQSIQLLRYFSLQGIDGLIKRPTVPSSFPIKRKHQWMQQGTDFYGTLGSKANKRFRAARTKSPNIVNEEMQINRKFSIAWLFQ